MARETSTQSNHPSDARRELLDRAKQLAQPNETIFDISSYPLLVMRPVQSDVQSLAEYGLSGDGNKQFLFVDGDVTKPYRFSSLRIYPAIRAEAYAQVETLAEAIVQWVKAVQEFDRASVVIGTKNCLRKTWRVDGAAMNGEVTPPSAFLKEALEKGLDLNQQGPAYLEAKAKAVEAAKAANLPLVKPARAKAQKQSSDREF